MERAGLDVLAEAEAHQPSTKFARSLASEGQRQRVSWVRLADGDPVGDSSGQHTGLARPCAGHDGDEA